ncbi:hypothetical protein [Sulfodiicoccus acidiphilus]|uniref:hypothetical protein n=1 Tax=Sulfodiicoccus acidiphilus TaxID=1670455 RepID=UPI000F8267D3|nr:hypothetical protein [Sulfodiicoccus acidiphilus]
MRLKSVSVPTDARQRSPNVRKVCLGDLECSALRTFLSFVAYPLGPNCDVVVSTSLSGEECTLVFTSPRSRRELLWMRFRTC